MTDGQITANMAEQHDKNKESEQALQGLREYPNCSERVGEEVAVYSRCVDSGLMPLNLNPPEAYQALPPISSFRAPLHPQSQSETLSSDPCSYVPDFSDLYQENTCVWQPLVDTREQTTSSATSDLDYLLERAGLYSQPPQQQCSVSGLDPYRTQHWSDQSVYESSYHDLQSKNSYGPSAYNTPQQLYPPSVQAPVGHLPTPYPMGYSRFANPYPEYLQASPQSYVPQGFLRNTWEQQPEQRAFMEHEQDQATGIRGEESLLKQYLLLPSHELGQISGVNISSARQNLASCLDRLPQLPQRRTNLPNITSRRQNRPKNSPSATVTSSTILPSNPSPPAAPPQVQTPVVSVQCPRPATTYPVPGQNTGATLVPPRCPSSLLRPATSAQATSATHMYIYLSAIARAAAAANGSSASNPQINPLFLQTQVPRSLELPANVLSPAVPPPRPKTPKRAASTYVLPGKRQAVGTVKEILRKKKTTEISSGVIQNPSDAAVSRPIQSVQPLTPFFIPPTQLLGDQWKVHVSPVLSIRPTMVSCRPITRGARSMSSFQRFPTEKKTRFTVPGTTSVGGGNIPPFKPGKVSAKEHRARHYEMGRLQIGNFVVLTGQLGNGKYINKLKAIFTKRRFVYEFETIFSPNPSTSTGFQSLQTGLFCVVVPFSTVTAIRCENGTQVRLMVDRQPLMYLGNRKKRQGVVEKPIVYDKTKPVDITNSQLKRSPLHLISLKPNQATTLQCFLWHFSERFAALSEIEFPLVLPEVELPSPEPDDKVPNIKEQRNYESTTVALENVTAPKEPRCREDDQSQRLEKGPVSVVMTLVEGELKETSASPQQDSEPVVSSTSTNIQSIPIAREDLQHLKSVDPGERVSTIDSRPQSPAESSSTEIDEIDLSTDVTPSVEIREADCGDGGSLVAGTCSCRLSCRSQRCACARGLRKCKLRAGDDTSEPSSLKCQCSGCDNPLNILVSLGITEEAAKHDQCLIHNVYKLLHLHSYLNQLVTLECCGEQAPLYKFLPGVVPCPNRFCKVTLQYSWCRQLVCDSTAAPPRHCQKCGLCRFNDTKHCESCNRCYSLSSADHPCPVCTVRSTLRTRIPFNKQDKL